MSRGILQPSKRAFQNAVTWMEFQTDLILLDGRGCLMPLRQCIPQAGMVFDRVRLDLHRRLELLYRRRRFVLQIEANSEVEMILRRAGAPGQRFGETRCRFADMTFASKCVAEMVCTFD